MPAVSEDNRCIRGGPSHWRGSTGAEQVQSPGDSRPTPPNSFWEGSYDLPQWFVTDSPSADTVAGTRIPETPTLSDTLVKRVGLSVSMVTPAMPISGSSDTDATARVQAVATTTEPPSIIRTAQAEDDNLLPVIQALADQMRPAHADIRQYPEEARVLLLSLIHI